MNGHEDIVRLLIEKGADVNARVDAYEPALQVAAANGHENIVRLLLEKGAYVNADAGCNELEHIALQVAARRGHKDIVRLLIEKGGADVNAVGAMKGTVLQAAAIKATRTSSACSSRRVPMSTPRLFSRITLPDLMGIVTSAM
jgi:ankyrin repeat protein